MGTLLYECPPLRARLTHKMCLLLRQKAARAPKPGKLSYRMTVSNTQTEIRDRVMLKPCCDCPGVKALLNRGETEPPREYPDMSNATWIYPRHLEPLYREWKWPD